MCVRESAGITYLKGYFPGCSTVAAPEQKQKIAKGS